MSDTSTDEGARPSGAPGAEPGSPDGVVHKVLLALTEEIQRPIRDLRRDLDRMLGASPDQTPTTSSDPPESFRTMLALCDEIQAILSQAPLAYALPAPPSPTGSQPPQPRGEPDIRPAKPARPKA